MSRSTPAMSQPSGRQDLSEIEPCHQMAFCKNSPANAPGAMVRCPMCRLASGNEEYSHHFWAPLPILQGFNRKHVVLEAEKKAASRNRRAAKANARNNRNRAKVSLLKKAVKAEQATESSIIKSTKNSGRSNQDGDHKMGELALDTKLQSTVVHPVVNLEELDKIRSQAEKNGLSAGGLVIHNKHGRKVVVFAWEDFTNVRAS